MLSIDPLRMIECLLCVECTGEGVVLIEPAPDDAAAACAAPASRPATPPPAAAPGAAAAPLDPHDEL
jgi:hypothetical protein